MMAKKTSKSTREQMYREIIEKVGLNWDDYKVLSFVFKYQMQTELFHYGLMAEKPVYALFDCWEKYVNVVVPKNEQNAAMIQRLAESYGGEKTTPNLR